MTIWVFNKPGDDAVEFISKSIKNGYSRFGWSSDDNSDLLSLNEKSWEELSDDEYKWWMAAYFLLDIKKDDWIVHVNVPCWGYCTAVKVLGEYSFDHEKNETGDYRHRITVDTETIIVFDRNDPNVHPFISRRLKLRGKFWRIYDVEKFNISISNLNNNGITLNENESTGLYHLKKQFPYQQITELIHQNHPGKKLEHLIAEIFRQIPAVENVIENGAGFGSDHGADLIVEYPTGLPVPGLESTGKLVIQVKSYTGSHFDLHAVEQIETAINTYDGDMGLLITTAQSTEEIEKAIEDKSNDIKKPIALIAGEDVAKLLLKYGSDILM